MKSWSKNEKSVRKQKAPGEQTHRPKVQYVRQPKYKTRWGIDNFEPNDWSDQ